MSVWTLRPRNTGGTQGPFGDNWTFQSARLLNWTLGP